MNLVQQLCEIYKLETWHEKRMTDEEAYAYHERILRDGHCITILDNNILAGYCEFYLSHGICHVSNLFIRKEYRRGRAIRMIKNILFKVCGKTRIYFGDRNKFNRKYPEFQFRRV